MFAFARARQVVREKLAACFCWAEEEWVRFLSVYVQHGEAAKAGKARVVPFWDGGFFSIAWRLGAVKVV
ncbi:hypothetical protein EB820_24765 [Brevibacillus agri]|uniref:Uncharacterized protein n=1 Tax=Brevibacillus agri TaxID=51101 RepID=A0A3M8A959_9BACL|nr:hypothetical protein [Brevibacillus agri]QAV12361.1 hypothetical protein BA6348_06030 [Brevibacillus agri]RNB47137.1 hypothetical protein EB820_24765 [Brevibacillus agri]